MEFETRTFRLTVQSPIHIGCGEVYDPTSFVVKEVDKKLVSFDPLLFLESLGETRLAEFSSLCQLGTVESLLDIYKFIDREAQGVAGAAVQVGEDFLRHFRSVLALNRQRIQRDLNRFEIERTAFNPISGEAYIPGSAIKGSLRTAVLNHRFAGKAVGGSFADKQGDGRLQEALLGGSFATDPFSRVKVSDFVAVGPVGKKVVYAVNEKKKQSDKEASALYQILETVGAGSVFEGSITVSRNAREAGVRRPVSFEELEAALKGFYFYECRREADQCRRIGAGHGVDFSRQTLPLRLGRHSGAECVTVDGVRKIKIRMGKSDSRELDHATTLWFASPMRKPSVKDDLRPFGWVALKPATVAEVAEGELYRQELRATTQAARAELRNRRQERAARRAEQLEQQQQRQLERERAEEEMRKYPWRPWLQRLQQIKDWGGFRQQVLENDQAADWRGEDGVGTVVQAVAEKVRSHRPDKWSEERDKLTAEWLRGAGVEWQQLTDAKPEDTAVAESEQEQQIRELKDWGQYKNSSLQIGQLELAAARALQSRFKDWGCNAKKAKTDKKKAWQQLQIRVKQLRDA